ncbi:peroxiredoxin Q/BCP [Fluviicoccus keumensis]|uniref:thioredoxin-dependent peroxiredoxin n=1 Tax=Fluviicoccus keumensis TaxID=1435465 RepID=A0A4Q7ZB88_9GAMM|nr:peroxiredoxin [Fluviicoccus keumensis]RZU47223.1 peroxiredoxin Q/BCP [Fluviicoccus keumensis]
MSLAIGDNLPALSVAATGNRTVELAALKGAPVVFYFYPRDATPGCTTEAQQFRDLMPEFDRLNCRVFGISRDTMTSHDRFKANECLPFDLLSDADEAMCKVFDVIRMKNMYGKQVLGLERSTFLFNAEGVLVKEWRKVKAPGHAAEVLQAVQAL